MERSGSKMLGRGERGQIRGTSMQQRSERGEAMSVG